MADKNIEINLKDVRLSFVNVFEPQEFVDKVTGHVSWKRNLSILVPKLLPNAITLSDGTVLPAGSKNPVVKQLAAAMKQAIENTWPGQDKKIPTDRRCVRDGEPIDADTVDPEVAGSGTRYALYEGYAGHIFVSANKGVKAKSKEEAVAAPMNVKVIGPRKTAKKEDGTPTFPTLRESDGLIYSGCYANVLIRIYGYDGKKDENPDRVNASLEIIQFKRHGDAFGAKAPDADAVMDEEGEDGFDVPGAAPPPEEDDIG